jgi:hypothetical protein
VKSAERCGTIRRANEGIRQPESSPSVGSVELGTASPPSDSGVVISRFMCALGGGVESVGQEIGKARALIARPFLELGRALQKKSVEEWSRVQVMCRLHIACGDCFLKFRDVARNQCAIQPDGFVAVKQLCIREVSALRGKNLIQCVAGFFCFTFRPENSQQLVAADSFFAGNRKHGKQSQPPTLRRRAGERSISHAEAESAEGVDPKGYCQMTLL